MQFQRKLADQAILAEALRQDFFEKQAISEAELETAYQEISKMMSGKEYNSSHILVETKEQAENLIAQLNTGASFQQLAQAHSIDPGSSTNGGELGWANAQTFVPEFADAMTQLKQGQYTKTPVQSQFGYHVILLTETRDVTPPQLNEISDQLKENLIIRKWEEYIETLVAQAKVK